MTKIMRAALCASLFAAASSVQADIDHQTFQFDCDVPQDRYSKWIGTLPPGVRQISGSVELHEPRRNKLRYPVASVFLTRGDQNIGLQLLFDRKADVLQVVALRPRDRGYKELLTRVPWKSSPVAFNLSLTQAGEVELTVAGKSVSLEVKDFGPEALSLSCSSAQFKFINVSVEADGGT